MSDSPRVTDQVALTTSSGRSWLVVAGLIALLCVGLLAALHGMPPLGAVVVGIVATVVEYLLMLVVRFAIGPGRLRLALLAVLTIAICVTFFVCAGAISLAAVRG